MDVFDYSTAHSLRKAFGVLQEDWDRLVAWIEEDAADTVCGSVRRDAAELTYQLLGLSFPIKIRLVTAVGTAAMLEFGLYERTKDKDVPIKAWYLGAGQGFYAVASSVQEHFLGLAGRDILQSQLKQAFMAAVFKYGAFDPLHPAPAAKR